MRPAPIHPLPPGVRGMWLAEALIGVIVLVGAAIAAAVVLGGVLMPWLPAAALVGGLAYLVAVPPRRYDAYRWELHDEELDLLAGIWRVTRTIVPLTRIQHVSVERTGWTSFFDLVRVHVHTAAGTTTIPGLERAQADDVRDRILARLRTPDDL